MRTVGGVDELEVSGKCASLRTLLARQLPTPQHNQFRTGLNSLDAILPHGGLRCGAIHELLFDSKNSSPKSLAMLLARAAQAATGGVIVWSDPKRELYSIALLSAGIDLRRLILLRPRNAAEEISALTECLRCKGVSATVTSLNRLTDIQARRLQLAAENGGGVGICLRPMLRGSGSNYAAATRWLVRPALENENSQNWNAELLHGHGGRVGSSVLLEVDRETGNVRASAPVAHRPVAPTPIRATA